MNARLFFISRSLLFCILSLTISIAAGCGAGETVTSADEESAKTVDRASAPLDTTPTATVRFAGYDGDAALRVAVARTESERARGLMFVDELGADEGMIFVWDTPVLGGFWMKNTRIPLSIAFVSEEHTIIEIQRMEPETLESHVPGEPYLYAIEANQGYFEKNGITAGDSVEISGV